MSTTAPEAGADDRRSSPARCQPEQRIGNVRGKGYPVFEFTGDFLAFRGVAQSRRGRDQTKDALQRVLCVMAQLPQVDVLTGFVQVIGAVQDVDPIAKRRLLALAYQWARCPEDGGVDVGHAEEPIRVYHVRKV